jgi:hypothetical protein
VLHCGVTLTSVFSTHTDLTRAVVGGGPCPRAVVAAAPRPREHLRSQARALPHCLSRPCLPPLPAAGPRPALACAGADGRRMAAAPAEVRAADAPACAHGPPGPARGRAPANQPPCPLSAGPRRAPPPQLQSGRAPPAGGLPGRASPAEEAVPAAARSLPALLSDARFYPVSVRLSAAGEVAARVWPPAPGPPAAQALPSAACLSHVQRVVAAPWVRRPGQQGGLVATAGKPGAWPPVSLRVSLPAHRDEASGYGNIGTMLVPAQGESIDA